MKKAEKPEDILEAVQDLATKGSMHHMIDCFALSGAAALEFSEARKKQMKPDFGPKIQKLFEKTSETEGLLFCQEVEDQAKEILESKEKKAAEAKEKKPKMLKKAQNNRYRSSYHPYGQSQRFPQGRAKSPTRQQQSIWSTSFKNAEDYGRSTGGKQRGNHHHSSHQKNNRGGKWKNQQQK